MHAEEGERRGRVVERRLGPGGVGCLVACIAGGREARGRVCGLAGGVVVPAVAAVAPGRDPTLEHLVEVAGFARQAAVGGVEREACSGAVVPVHGPPGGRPMTGLARVAETRPEAVVLAADPVTVVAAVRGSLELTVDVAGRARDRKVAILERERRRLVERTRGPEPLLRGVARLAAGTKRTAVHVLVARRTRRAGPAKRTATPLPAGYLPSSGL